MENAERKLSFMGCCSSRRPSKPFSSRRRENPGKRSASSCRAVNLGYGDVMLFLGNFNACFFMLEADIVQGPGPVPP